MMKLLHDTGKPVILDIKTRNGAQVFYGRVRIDDVAGIDTSAVKVTVQEDITNNQFVVKIEV